MRFCDKLIELRREKGYSQEQLASVLGVSRQAVSKWEAGASMPDLSKLMQLSELFLVTTDYLLKEEIEERQYEKKRQEESIERLTEAQTRILEKLERMEEHEKNAVKEYEYISEKKLFGMPLVHIHFKWTKRFQHGLGMRTVGVYADFGTKAKGILAIGNNATGVLSIGFLAKGMISIGLFSLGAFAFGILCLGLLGLGVIAMGGLTAGVVALGYVAMGVCAIGIYGTGITVLAKKAAVGMVVVARTAIGSEDAAGTYTMLVNELTGRQEVIAFLKEHQPDLPKWILFLLTRRW